MFYHSINCRTIEEHSQYHLLFVENVVNNFRSVHIISSNGFQINFQYSQYGVQLKDQIDVQKPCSIY